MPLTEKQKEEIRKIRFGWFYEIDENGQPKYPSKDEEKPNFDVGEIRKLIFQALENRDYIIYKGKPQSANCIIRVYKEEREYEGSKYRIMGAHCYTKAQDGKWKSIDRIGEEFGFDFNQHEMKIWLFQDETWDVSVDFFDTYVKIVKEN